MRHQATDPISNRPEDIPVLSWDDVILMPTRDGSDTLWHRSLGVHYHSTFGAVSESRHVFLLEGLMFRAEQPRLDILEMGFGTGLNAFLAFLYAIRTEKEITYTGIEPFPIDPIIAQKLNYPEYLAFPEERDIFHRMHTSTQFRSETFSFSRILHLELISDSLTFDCIFFDAFAPADQPECWRPEIFSQLFSMTKPGGCVVTYCAQGEVRRRMLQAGYQVSRLPGPPGKREMLRAVKSDV